MGKDGPLVDIYHDISERKEHILFLVILHLSGTAR